MLVVEKELLKSIKQSELTDLYCKIKNGEKTKLEIRGIELAIDVNGEDVSISRLNGDTNILCSGKENYKIIIMD